MRGRLRRTPGWRRSVCWLSWLTLAAGHPLAAQEQTGTIVGEIPSGVQLLKTGSPNLRKSVIEVMNSYSFRFSSSIPASAVEVKLRPPAGLPPLTVTTW